jgi:pimeloyl-ACP methyl ester carboxylesterase
MVGHSKGGNMLLQLAEAMPHRITRLVNIDGMPSPRPHPDVHDRERTKLMADEIRGWLEHRRRIAGHQRRPGTIEELAQRRGRMNPRLGTEWLEYLVTVGARESPDGWRWKIDPALRFGGFGPWRHVWSLQALPGVSVPMLGVLGLEPEMMGWGTRPEQLEPYLPRSARLEVFEDAGHFVHIERPRRVADLVLGFLA